MADYSIVVPVFNSEFTLRKLYDRTVEVFKQLDKTVEFVFVDDSSLDNSWEVLKSVKALNPKNVTIIRFNKNYGQQNATFCGMEHAKGSFIITMDDDLQQPPEEIPRLYHLDVPAGCPVVDLAGEGGCILPGLLAGTRGGGASTLTPRSTVGSIPLRTRGGSTTEIMATSPPCPVSCGG